MIRWIGEKNIDLLYINTKILECLESKIFTNFGKNNIELEKFIHKKFLIDKDKSVILVSNGSMGLNALIGMYNTIYDKKLKWATQSFTFPCGVQGLLNEQSIVFDIDYKYYGIDLNELKKNINEYDGIIITNCFGNCVNIKVYEDFCRENNKLLIFDNAATSYTFYENKNVLNYGDACMVSLHHTKPVGFGEGGFIVINNKYEKIIKKIINFGYDTINKHIYDSNASNYKMSEIQAIYIRSYLETFDTFHSKITSLFIYFKEKFKMMNFNKIKMFYNYSNDNRNLLSCISIIMETPMNIDYFLENDIEAKKYYYPLKNTINSIDLFSKIICLPLNYSLSTKDMDYYINILKKLENNFNNYNQC